jgi:glycosyltransferase involved in cell wall biosynthesis
MPLALLYAGRLSPEKGIETAIEAISILIKNGNQVRLSVVGGGESGYVQQLQERVQAAGLKDAIRFLGPVAKEEMPPLYRQFDAFLFPSVWQEPFGRVLVEAMASGLVVIGTATGGAGEILQDEETALVFAPGDAAGLAKQIMRVQQPGLRWRIAQNGRRAALGKFDMGRMITEIEALLNTILARVA